MKKNKIKAIFQKFIKLFFNKHFLICFGLAWCITNGWCYVFIGLGSILKIGWMRSIGLAYFAFLWLPCTPEKIVTVIIAVCLNKLIFPKDVKTKEDLENMSKEIKKELKNNFIKQKDK